MTYNFCSIRFDTNVWTLNSLCWKNIYFSSCFKGLKKLNSGKTNLLITVVVLLEVGPFQRVFYVYFWVFWLISCNYYFLLKNISTCTFLLLIECSNWVDSVIVLTPQHFCFPEVSLLLIKKCEYFCHLCCLPTVISVLHDKHQRCPTHHSHRCD